MPQDTPTYLSLKLAAVRKTSPRATGDITYRILCDENRTSLFFTIVGNAGGGYWSREILPFERIEACLAEFADSNPFRAKNLSGAFVGRSVNSWGFLLAALRAEGLVAPVPDSLHQHQKAGNWADWKDTMLRADGEIYVPPAKSEASSAIPPPESGASEATESAGADSGAGDSGGASVPPGRKGRGSKARPVGGTREPENDDARPA